MRRSRTNRHTKLNKRDLQIISMSLWIQNYGYKALQYLIALIFIWFALLKLTATAEMDLLMSLFVAYIPQNIVMPFFGIWELFIGISMLRSTWIFFSLKLLIAYIPFTLLPFIFTPELCFIDFPLVLSLEGKSIISQLALISGAVVIGGRQHTKIIELKV